MHVLRALSAVVTSGMKTKSKILHGTLGKQTVCLVLLGLLGEGDVTLKLRLPIAFKELTK